MQFFTFCRQILSIRTISANIGSCPRTTLPLPHGLPLGSRDCFLSFVVILIMAAFNALHEGTACIYKGKEKPVMKCSFLQALSAFGVNQRAKELGIQDYMLKLQCKQERMISWCKRLTPEPCVGTNQRDSEDRNSPITASENHPIAAEHNAL